MQNLDAAFKSKISEGILSAHGNQCFLELSSMLKNEKTDQIIQYFNSFFFQQPIVWDNVKDKVWPNAADQDRNKFLFLQGDIIQTKMVQELGTSLSAQTHNMWLVLTPSCDLVSDLQYIRVAKVVRVDISDKNSDSEGYSDFKKLFTSCKFKTNKFFPMPPLLPAVGNPENTYAYYADLVTPFYLAKQDAPLATPISSLKFDAWHILNMFLMQNSTRSNPSDEPIIRCASQDIKMPVIDKLQFRVYTEVGEFRSLTNHFCGTAHSDHLKDKEEFVGKWVKISEEKNVYWLFQKNLNTDEIIQKTIN